MGYGLGGLFHSVARAVMPMVKSGAKTLGNIALNTGADFLGGVLSGKSVKESAKVRVNEAENAVKRKPVNKLETLSQTGSGKRARKISVKKTVNKPGDRKQLVFKIYLDNYETCTFEIGRVYKK